MSKLRIAYEGPVRERGVRAPKRLYIRIDAPNHAQHGYRPSGVPETTMKAIAGWMSAKMLERYSHTRNQAKRDAVNKLPRRRPK